MILPPSASGLSNSIRGMGYSFEMAVADIIDNSISAGAKHISIETPLPEDGIDYMIIADDGVGMTRSELIAAMKLGSCSPIQPRKLTDLGRFGMGLKSASFSQCRKLLVASKKNNEINAFSWDIDELERENDWKLLEIDPEFEERKISYLNKVESGTVVVWEKIDKIATIVSSSQDDNLEIIRNLRKHLSLTFHRFLENNEFELILNGQNVKPWDPFK